MNDETNVDELGQAVFSPVWTEWRQVENERKIETVAEGVGAR